MEVIELDQWAEGLPGYSRANPIIIKEFDQSDLLAEFHLFKMLPNEIQLAIWKEATDSIPSRIVPVEPKFSGNFIPSVLHVCSTSRAEAMHRYKRMEWTRDSTFFIDVKNDVLFFTSTAVPWGTRGPTNEIKKVLLYSQNYNVLGRDGYFITKFTNISGNLPEILVAVNEFDALPSGDQVCLRTRHALKLERRKDVYDSEVKSHIADAKRALCTYESAKTVAAKFIERMLERPGNLVPSIYPRPSFEALRFVEFKES
ncbi:hypothetical protein HYFRA_00009338 [Hymenoscyphus fraxineus]|uniref:2EXR domain-containing protein n=1 Tax=Hymenoscyphus fraxineus TaxID=746836 RepID=A0A9N9L3Z2_9HELO|nr:hypothetical protein HYFRA_00009338 [Hymenoscyphus fraxineus]